MRRALTDRPALGVLLGAVLIAFSGILFRKSHVSPATGAFFRCFWALPFLLARSRSGRTAGSGPRPQTVRRAAWLAGAFFAADLILWHYSIEYVGAGLATVLGNTQVVLVGLLAWALFRERPARNALYCDPGRDARASSSSRACSRAARTGAIRSSARSSACSPGIAYSGFLLAMRRGSGERGRVAGPLYDATLASADLRRSRSGSMIGDLDFTPSLEATAWLHPARAQLPGGRLAADHSVARAVANSAAPQCC